MSNTSGGNNTATGHVALFFNTSGIRNTANGGFWGSNSHGIRADMVVANGVTINSGATVALRGQTTGALTQGMVLTLIRNTSADPVSGTFSNLPDGAIVTINGNNLQASYEGGDGNDLTLTAVP